MKVKLRAVATEAKLLLIGIPVFLWTMIPIYHLFLFSISPRDSATSGKLWPDHPTLQNFSIVLHEQHFYLNHFWLQLWNSLVIALAVGALTLFVSTCAAFAISTSAPGQTIAGPPIGATPIGAAYCVPNNSTPTGGSTEVTP